MYMYNSTAWMQFGIPHAEIFVSEIFSYGTAPYEIKVVLLNENFGSESFGNKKG